tara:strand:+ start:339 stop:524 length:186 start_codon:yes stop_codon:yes gene_type:complete
MLIGRKNKSPSLLLYSRGINTLYAEATSTSSSVDAAAKKGHWENLTLASVTLRPIEKQKGV